jgi:hypothetical protein
MAKSSDMAGLLLVVDGVVDVLVCGELTVFDL